MIEVSGGRPELETVEVGGGKVELDSGALALDVGILELGARLEPATEPEASDGLALRASETVMLPVSVIAMIVGISVVDCGGMGMIFVQLVHRNPCALFCDESQSEGQRKETYPEDIKWLVSKERTCFDA